MSVCFSTGSSAVHSPGHRRRCTCVRGFAPRSRHRTESRARRGNPRCVGMPCTMPPIPPPAWGSATRRRGNLTHQSGSTPWRRSSSRPFDCGPRWAPRTTWHDRAYSNNPRQPPRYPLTAQPRRVTIRDLGRRTGRPPDRAGPLGERRKSARKATAGGIFAGTAHTGSNGPGRARDIDQLSRNVRPRGNRRWLPSGGSSKWIPGTGATRPFAVGPTPSR